MAFREVGVERQNAAGFFQIPKGIGGGGVAQHIFQFHGNGGLRVAGVVQVVGIHPVPREFLGQIQLLVGAVVSRQQPEPFARALVRTQALGNDLQGFIPVRRFQPPVAPDEGTAQPLPTGNPGKPEFALVTRLPAIGRRIDFGNGANDPALLVQLQVDLAPHRAVAADGALYAGRLFPLALPFRERAHRAHINAGAAKLAARLQQRSTKGSPHQRLAGAFREADGAVAPHLLAGAHAAPAGDAQVVVPVVERIAYFQRDVAVGIGHRRFQLHAQIPHGVLEFAALVFGAGNAAVVDGNMTQADIRRPADLHPVAGQAPAGMLRDEHLHHGTPQLLDIGGFAPYGHAVGHGQGAGGGKAPPAVHRHHAHPAGRVGFHPRVVAQIGHIDARVNSGFQHHFAGPGLDFNPVNGDGNVVRHSDSGGECCWDQCCRDQETRRVGDELIGWLRTQRRVKRGEKTCSGQSPVCRFSRMCASNSSPK